MYCKHCKHPIAFIPATSSYFCPYCGESTPTEELLAQTDEMQNEEASPETQANPLFSELNFNTEKYNSILDDNQGSSLFEDEAQIQMQTNNLNSYLEDNGKASQDLVQEAKQRLLWEYEESQTQKETAAASAFNSQSDISKRKTPAANSVAVPQKPHAAVAAPTAKANINKAINNETHKTLSPQKAEKLTPSSNNKTTEQSSCWHETGTWFCPFCGRKNHGTKSCVWCGHTLSEQQMEKFAASKAIQTQNGEPKRLMSKPQPQQQAIINNKPTSDRAELIRNNLHVLSATLPAWPEIADSPLLQDKLQYTNHWWWLKATVPVKGYAPTIDNYGNFHICDTSVNFENCMVKPILKISISKNVLKVGDYFKYHGKKFIIIDSDTAFCTEDIGMCCFRKDYLASDSGDYEASDVKKLIDNWFSKKAQTQDKIPNYGLEGGAAYGNVLKPADLLVSETVEYTDNGHTYIAYNGFIDKTAGAHWIDADSFVKMLNKYSFDDCVSWRLLMGPDESISDATAWKEASNTDVIPVPCLWSSQKLAMNAYMKLITTGIWNEVDASSSSPSFGFVVIREKQH